MPKSVTFDKDQVLQDAMKLFWKKGYNGTSMQDLVEVTGLNRSSFYNTFGDKFSLFQAVLKFYQKQVFDYFQSVVERNESPRQAIASVFRDFGAEAKNGIHSGCLLTNSTSELSETIPIIRDFLIDNRRQVQTTFKDLIVKAQMAGEISKEKDPDQLALYLFSSLNGLRITCMLSDDADGVVEEILAHL